MNNQTARLLFTILLLQAGFPPTTFAAEKARTLSSAIIDMGRALQSPSVASLASSFENNGNAALTTLQALSVIEGVTERWPEVGRAISDCGQLYRLAISAVDISLDRAIDQLQV